MFVPKMRYLKRSSGSLFSFGNRCECSGSLLDNKFIDLTICNRGKEYRVHKLIVCGAIPYFAEMFSSETEELSINRIEVDHPTEIFDIIINWAYDRTIYITTANKLEVRKLANHLGMTTLFRISHTERDKSGRINRCYPPAECLYNKFIDLTIYNRGKEYRVHKIILCSFIPYFNAMFSSGMKESTANEIELDQPTEIFDMIIDWAYDRDIEIKSANVSELKKVADYFCMEDLLLHCLDFERKERDPHNSGKSKI